MKLTQQTALIPLYDALTRLGLLNTRYGLVIIHAAWGMPLQILLLTSFLAGQLAAIRGEAMPRIEIVANRR